MKLEIDTDNLSDIDKQIINAMSAYNMNQEQVPLSIETAEQEQPEEPEEYNQEQQEEVLTKRKYHKGGIKVPILKILKDTDAGYSVIDIAEELGNSEGAVYQGLQTLVKEHKAERSSNKPFVYYSSGATIRKMKEMLPKKQSYMG